MINDDNPSKGRDGIRYEAGEAAVLEVQALRQVEQGLPREVGPARLERGE